MENFPFSYIDGLSPEGVNYEPTYALQESTLLSLQKVRVYTGQALHFRSMIPRRVCSMLCIHVHIMYMYMSLYMCMYTCTCTCSHIVACIVL